MTDQEINESVARKLGKNLTPGCQCGNEACPDPEHEIDPPDYCHSTAAAWEVVDKFKGDFYLRRETIEGDTQYEASFWNNDLPPQEACLGHEWADTAPMAICLAFLKLNDKTL